MNLHLIIVTDVLILMSRIAIISRSLIKINLHYKQEGFDNGSNIYLFVTLVSMSMFSMC